MSSSIELARVAALRALFARSSASAKGVCVGIGDDAAVLEVLGDARDGDGAGAGKLVWTVDAQVEGTHFRADWASWEDVGWRSFMAAASDLAAMGAEPVAALSALVLAPSVDDQALEALARGQAAAAEAIGAPVVGGNLSRGKETSITTTLLGRTSRPVLRSGAEPGDRLWLAGAVGLAGAGLALLQVGGRVDLADEGARPCLAAWRRPIARIAEGRALAGLARAAIDVSDGLAHDAWQLAEASGVRLVLDRAETLAAGGGPLALAAAMLGREPLDLALHGGEDYALLAASKQDLPGFLRIGAVEAWDANQHGGARVLVTSARGAVAVERRGFDHFARA